MSFKTLKTSKGFTLPEVLIALVLIATILGYAIPKLGQSTASQLKTATRRLISLNKEIRNYARLTRKTYRLVLDFGSENRKPGIRVESAPKNQLIEDHETKQKKKDSSKEEKSTTEFAPAPEVLKKPIDLPFGVKIESVEYEDPKDNVKEGTAYVYFFPQGNAQKAIIHLSNGANIHWSLIILPLTGHTYLRTQDVSLKDVE